MRKQLISLTRLNLTASGLWKHDIPGLEDIPTNHYVLAAIINATAGDGGHNGR